MKILKLLLDCFIISKNYNCKLLYLSKKDIMNELFYHTQNLKDKIFDVR
jgi:hypothetical protein